MRTPAKSPARTPAKTQCGARVVRTGGALAAAALLGAALAPGAAAETYADRLAAYWTRARMTAAVPGDGTDRADGTGGSESAARTGLDGPQPGEQIPPSRSFSGIPQVGTFFWTDADGTGRTCTGSVVHSPGHDLVLSAGHCLTAYSGAAPARHLAFVPGYDDGREPYGVFPVKPGRVYVPQEYYDLGKHAGAGYDVGFTITEPGRGGRRLEDVTGAFELRTDTGYAHDPVRMVGYPGGGARHPVDCRSRSTRWTSDDPAEPGVFPRVACDGFVGGTSGSPMLVPSPEGWAVIGAIGGFHAGGDTDQVSYSPYFGAAVRALYRAAVGGTPPAAG
jgi:V8-like Glu-specific endopeptidase